MLQNIIHTLIPLKKYRHFAESNGSYFYYLPEFPIPEPTN